MLQAAAFQLGDAVGVGAQHEGAEDGQTLRTGSVLPDLRLAGLDEADVAQLADLAAVHGVGVGVLVGLDELLAGLEVVGCVGMDDGDVAVADGVSVHRAQLCRRLEEQLRGQGAALVQRLAAGDGSLGAVCGKLRRIDDVGAAGQHIAGDAVHGAACLACQNAGGLYHIVVDGGHIQGLAVGSHALGQRGIGLGQAVVLAELNGLAAVLGYGIVVRELVMHQTGLCLVDKALLVEGLHLVGHGAGGVLQAGRRVGKELEVHLQVVAFHVICPFCIKTFKN